MLSSVLLLHGGVFIPLILKLEFIPLQMHLFCVILLHIKNHQRIKGLFTQWPNPGMDCLGVDCFVQTRYDYCRQHL